MTASADDKEPLPADPARSQAADEIWDEIRIDPVKVALPNATVGYTLRAYRPASQLTPPEAAEPEDDPFVERERAQDQDTQDQDIQDQDILDTLDDEATGPETEDLEKEPEPEDLEEKPADEEVPVFLSHRGRLLLFGSPESLVSFIGSGALHDLTQLDTWDVAAKRIQAADIVPTDEDTYELDLVVENLRGGHDAWDLPLLISAGECARDIGWALRLEPVIAALAPGSPLDDLDEALRTTADGGIKGMLGRRRLRGIGAQQVSLGWRTIIGKISGVVDWRD